MVRSGLKVPIKMMAWSLSFGACLGGNATLVGAAANVVACGVAQQKGYPIKMLEFSKVGLPFMLVNVTMVYCYSLFAFVAGGYHG